LIKNNSVDISLTKFPKSRKENLVIQNTGEELLVYDLDKNKALCLNETSALVWQSCNGKNGVSDIAKLLEKKFNLSVSEDLVLFTLNELDNENLLESDFDKINKFNGLSRREVIKRIGFSSMIALPIIAAVVAPDAIHAQSCVGTGADFAPGTQTAAGNIANCPTSNICDTQGTNCCTGVATITCNGAGTGVVPFTCNCT
jgi:hypothetical protein